MYVFVSEDHIVDWHPCQICYLLEIKLLLLLLLFRPVRRVDGGGGGVREVRTHPPSWVNYFKIMQFSPETEFTPLILASKSDFS